MKIIKRGTVPTPEGEKVHKATCRNCKTKIEFQQKEANVDGRDGDRSLSIACPVCNTSIYKNL
jgi:hypothetical protein